MQTIKKIIQLSKKLASSIIKDERIDTSYLSNSFDEENATYIIKELSDPKIKKERDRKIKTINKTKDNDWATIKAMTQTHKRSRVFKTVYNTAATVAILMMLGLGFNYYVSNDNNLLDENNISFKNEVITLELGKGNEEIILTEDTASIYDSKGNIIGIKKGEVLDYSRRKKEKGFKSLALNQLKVPYGRVFQIILPDGTKVHLNSGSILQYPDNFIEGGKRVVSLVGEALFDVSKDKKHPFIVKTKHVDVRVLGTKFNVMAYPEDEIVSTVLVEGLVQLQSKKKLNTKLYPGERAIISKLEEHETKVDKVDTSIHTAWVNGDIVFQHMVFANILKKLERHYNVSITNNNNKLAKEKFTASFDTESIDQVLNSFSKNYKFEFVTEGKNITIN